jgi:hypothetical protein
MIIRVMGSIKVIYIIFKYLTQCFNERAYLLMIFSIFNKKIIDDSII